MTHDLILKGGRVIDPSQKHDGILDVAFTDGKVSGFGKDLKGAKEIRDVSGYIVTPGQATSYKVGMVRIVALREEARKALGPRFDIKGFHEAVLGAGALPLNVLDGRVRAWIRSRQGRA